MRAGILAIASLVAGLGAAHAGGPSGLNGSWAGEMRQIEVTAETTYPMTLKLAGNRGRSDYPTLNCSGRWTKVGARGGYVIYAEKIENRKGATCVDGMVTVKLNEGKVVLGWFAALDGEPFLGAAALSRQTAAK